MSELQENVEVTLTEEVYKKHTMLNNDYIYKQMFVIIIVWVNGIQERKMGTCNNHCYSSDSSPVELYKPSHKHSIVIKFFLSHNKH